MIKKLKEFDRKDFFDYYNNSCDNSFLSFTIKLDVTKIVKFAKKHKTSFYATMGYLLTKAINNVDNFKYRYFEGEFYYCDKIRANYTQIKDGEVAFFGMPDIENYYEYIKTKNLKIKLMNFGFRALLGLSLIRLWFLLIKIVYPHNFFGISLKKDLANIQ